MSAPKSIVDTASRVIESVASDENARPTFISVIWAFSLVFGFALARNGHARPGSSPDEVVINADAVLAVTDDFVRGVNLYLPTTSDGSHRTICADDFPSNVAATLGLILDHRLVRDWSVQTLNEVIGDRLGDLWESASVADKRQVLLITKRVYDFYRL